MNVSPLTPWLSDFHTVWFCVSSGCFLFLNLLLSLLWLCEEQQCIYLCLHVGWKSITHFFWIAHSWYLFFHYLNFLCDLVDCHCDHTTCLEPPIPTTLSFKWNVLLNAELGKSLEYWWYFHIFGLAILETATFLFLFIWNNKSFVVQPLWWAILLFIVINTLTATGLHTVLFFF